MNASRRHVAIYIVRSPLHYLAARCVAQTFEAGVDQFLFYYQKGLETIIRNEDWNAVQEIPWPRKKPLPGLFGVHRRLLANLRNVAAVIGRCDSIHIHASIFDAEGTNYFLRGLPRLTGAHHVRGRILPDGLVSTRRYPLSLQKRWLIRLRKFRRLVSPELDYWCFSGDRIGTDASFVDRIYTLPGLPHQYPREKVVELPPLIKPAYGTAKCAEDGLRALVIGQPLTRNNLMAPEDLPRVTDHIHRWLHEQGVRSIDYKGHPRDPRNELMRPYDRLLDINEPIEVHMSHTHYDFVVGVRSSVLLFAKQIYGPAVRVVAFDWDLVRFKSAQERADMAQAFSLLGVEMR